MHLPAPIKEAEVNAETIERQSLIFTNGAVAETSVSNVTELFVRASGVRTGYAYTQDLAEEPEQVIKRAYQNSEVVERDGKDQLNTSQTVKQVLKPTQAEHSSFDSLKQQAQICESMMRQSNEQILNTTTTIRADHRSSHVINSNGVNLESHKTVYYANITVMATYNGLDYNASLEATATSLTGFNYTHICDKINNILKYQINPVKLETGYYKAVLDATAGVNIMMTAWQLFSGMKYNDGSSALAGKLGEQIGSEAFSVKNVPNHPLTGYTYDFDCEGSPVQTQTLVECGKLNALMENLASAGERRMASTGNAGRYALLSGTIPTDIIITPTIFYIEASEQSIDELLEKMGDGIYITESYDVFHSINIASGEFSIPCRGVIVKNGKIEDAVTNLTISGNLQELFQSVLATGSDLYIEEFLRQSYAVGSPSMLVDKLHITGK